MKLEHGIVVRRIILCTSIMRYELLQLLIEIQQRGVKGAVVRQIGQHWCHCEALSSLLVRDCRILEIYT